MSEQEEEQIYKLINQLFDQNKGMKITIPNMVYYVMQYLKIDIWQYNKTTNKVEFILNKHPLPFAITKYKPLDGVYRLKDMFKREV